MGNTRHKGKKSENIGGLYLEKKGYDFIEENFQTSFGEIDLVMRDGDFIVFIEVKSLKKDLDGQIYGTFRKTKRKRVYSAIKDWLRKNKKWDDLWRLDFLGIVEKDGKLVFSHFKFIEV